MLLGVVTKPKISKRKKYIMLNYSTKIQLKALQIHSLYALFMQPWSCVSA